MQYLKVPFSRWLILPLVLFFIPLAAEMYGPNGLNEYYGEIKGALVDMYDLSVNEYSPYEESIRKAQLQLRVDKLEQLEANPESFEQSVRVSMSFMMLNLLCSILWMGLNMRLVQNTKAALKSGGGRLNPGQDIMPQINTKDDLGAWVVFSLKTFGFWILSFLGSLASVWLVFLLGLIGVIALMMVSEILGFIALTLWLVYLITYILLYYVAAQYFYVDTEEVTEGIAVKRNKKFIAKFWGKMFKLYGVLFLWSLVFIPLYLIALMSGVFAVGAGLLTAALLSAYFYCFLSVLYGKYFYQMAVIDESGKAVLTEIKTQDLKREKTPDLSKSKKSVSSVKPQTVKAKKPAAKTAKNQKSDGPQKTVKKVAVVRKTKKKK